MKKIKAQVVMLPTEKASHILKRSSASDLLWYSRQQTNEGFVHLETQHLYIISDEEAEEGDWCYYKDGFDSSLFKVTNVDEDGRIYEGITAYPFHKCGKIIATTDTLLRLKTPIGKNVSIVDTMKDYSDLHNYGVFERQLPQIPQSFIKEYCEQGGIDEVELGYITNNINDQEIMFHEEHKEDFFEDFVNGKYVPYVTLKEGLKLTPNNEVVIH